MFDLPLFTKLLHTEKYGQQVTWLATPDSTNTELWKLVDNQTVAAGQLVITDHQRNGRGRAGRSWFSQPGKSLCCSLLMEVRLPPELLGLVALAGGLAVAQALTAENLAVALKWPNDIVYKGCKLGGLLTESRQGSSTTMVVLGLGLNISQASTDFPAPIASAATSVQMLGGIDVGTEQLLANILLELETIALRDYQGVTSSWMKYCAHQASAVSFHKGVEMVTGRFTGLTEQGHALIETAAGVRTIGVGDLHINGDDEI